jgi:hypothetical protein
MAASVALAVFCSPHGAVAGTTGVLSGHVFSVYGDPLVGATVQLVDLRDRTELNREIDFRRRLLDSRTTDAHGFFVFLSLEPGFYVIRPVLQGWNFYCPPRVVVFADQTSFVDFLMTNAELDVRCSRPGIFGPY